MENITDKLHNTVDLHKKNPDTFYCPLLADPEDLKGLKKGDNVKVGGNKERYWMEVVDNDPKTQLITATVANVLINKHDYNTEDIVQFEYKNVYQVYDS